MYGDGCRSKSQLLARLWLLLTCLILSLLEGSNPTLEMLQHPCSRYWMHGRLDVDISSMWLHATGIHDVQHV